MKLIELTGKELLEQLKLKEDAKPNEFQTAVGNLVTLAETQAAELVTLRADKQAADDAKAAAEVKLAEVENAANESRLVTLLDTAEKVDRKITADQRPFLMKLGYDEAEKFLKTLAPNPTAEQRLKEGAEGDADGLLKLTWDEADKQGKLKEIKLNHPAHYAALGKKKFGENWSGPK
jgi:hypothetical protein